MTTATVLALVVATISLTAYLAQPTIIRVKALGVEILSGSYAGTSMPLGFRWLTLYQGWPWLLPPQRGV